MPVEQSVSLLGSVEMRAMLNRLPKDLQRELRPRLRQAAELVAEQARANARSMPTKKGGGSTRIPGAISVRTSFAVNKAGATVVVDSKAAPHARPIEGIATRGSTFRHPVFGRDVWVPQRTRPFLIPAGQAKEAEAARLAEQAVNDATARAR